MSVEQLLTRVVRDNSTAQQAVLLQLQLQNEVLEQLAAVLDRLERVLTLPDRTRDKTAR